MTAQTTIFSELYAALSGVEGITGVFDGEAPADQKGPYIVIGQSQELRGRVIDDSERTLIVTLHLWSNYNGRAEVLKLFGLIEDAMPENYCFDDAEILKDSDSGWQHGILTYRVYFRRG